VKIIIGTTAIVPTAMYSAQLMFMEAENPAR
jgi:hypothetical protein